MDVATTGTPGVLVNTYHLWRMIPAEQMTALRGVATFMHWDGATISDSGGFQVMSLVKKMGGKVTDDGVYFKPENSPTLLLTPEESIQYQLALGTDLCVVLDDFTPPEATYEQAEETVTRTILWATRSKLAFDEVCQKLQIPKEKRPYLIAPVQGGFYPDLRRRCARELARIGFDGFGWGGWPVKPDGTFDEESGKIMAEEAPAGYLLYGLGIGKPSDIVAAYRLGWTIFDCVIPTRDARHNRLYFWTGEGLKYTTKNAAHAPETSCDCYTCTHYDWAYVNHLFTIGDTLSYRLASIHNLRFYAQLMEKLRVLG